MPRGARIFDCIVAGVGGMGSAAVYHLARRGLKVLGIERFNIPHDLGSSHGITRIIRLAYYEDPSYVPLLRRAYALWRELQRTAREPLLHITGSIDAGPAGSQVFEGSRQSCIEHDLKHEVFDGRALAKRFPGYRLPRATQALFQPEGGFLVPERCIVAHAEQALAKGAEIHGRERLISWKAGRSGAGVTVRTDRATYEAGRLVLATGAWMSQQVPELARVAIPERQVLVWMQPKRPELFTPGRFPVFNLLVEEGRWYGFPVFGVPGFKYGRWHHREEQCDPERVDRECHPRDEKILRALAERYFPDAAGPTLALKACMFTNTPDEHFIVDLHPRYPQVVLVSPCSGHGFKFCSVVGEIAADLAQRGETRHDISMFRLDRFGAKHPAAALV